jgi:hypothetical protein
MLRERDAGGPTGTMREPNSTPMVTSWCGEKRPSQRRTVSYGRVSITVFSRGRKLIHLIYRIQSRRARQSSLCSPTAETCGRGLPNRVFEVRELARFLRIGPMAKMGIISPAVWRVV